MYIQSAIRWILPLLRWRGVLLLARHERLGIVLLCGRADPNQAENSRKTVAKTVQIIQKSHVKHVALAQAPRLHQVEQRIKLLHHV